MTPACAETPGCVQLPPCSARAGSGMVELERSMLHIALGVGQASWCSCVSARKAGVYTQPHQAMDRC